MTKAYKTGYAKGYKKGHIVGVKLGYSQAKARFHAANYKTLQPPIITDKERRELRREEIRLNALRDICQAGTGITEAMSKALLSIDHNL